MSISGEPQRWDNETDLLIVGGGTSGLPCAISAVEVGAKVTVIELTKRCGGSGSLIAAGASFAGTPIQKKQGIDDSPDLLYKDGVEIAEGSPDLWRIYADNQLDTFHWLMSIGAPPSHERLFMPPGHRQRRLHFYKGAKVMNIIEKQAKEKGVEVLFGYRATRLIRDWETGGVMGVRVKVKNDVKNFRAKKAVILATGGFGRNKEMLREYGHRFIDCVPLMAPAHLGDGLRMGLDIGAATKYIGQAVVASLPVCATTKSDSPIYTILAGAIALNSQGERFYDESCPKGFYGNLTDAAIDQPDGLFWFVYDSKMRTHPLVKPTIGKCNEYKADNLEELAKLSGVNPKGLTKTIERYNEDIESEGYDTVFGRKHLMSIDGELVTIDTPPFYAVKCKTSITSFKGGLRINTKCQVINNYGEPIPGLFAVGEVTGGLFGKGIYLGGTMWPSAMTFGRLTGRTAAFEMSY